MHRFLTILYALSIAFLLSWLRPLAHATEPSMESEQPHIALLLPLSVGPYAQYAQYVKLGFLEAAKVDAGVGFPIKVYVTSDQTSDVVASYGLATKSGAKLIVGPLGKDAATAVAKSGLVSVPTLALSLPDGEFALPSRFYVFGMQVDSEARFVAQLALRDGKRRALIVFGSSPIEHRLGQSFFNEWTKFGGEAVSQFDYNDDRKVLANINQIIVGDGIDTIFLALNSNKARLVRPYLDTSVSTFATSQVFPGNDQTLAMFDLDRIRFVDMPWLLQPDHPGVMSYLGVSENRLSAEFDRFLALGIDAYRLAQELLAHPDEENIFLDGVTGEIQLKNGNQFVRKPLQAMFYGGHAVVLQDLLHRDLE